MNKNKEKKQKKAILLFVFLRSQKRMTTKFTPPLDFVNEDYDHLVGILLIGGFTTVAIILFFVIS